MPLMTTLFAGAESTCIFLAVFTASGINPLIWGESSAVPLVIGRPPFNSGFPFMMIWCGYIFGFSRSSNVFDEGFLDGIWFYLGGVCINFSNAVGCFPTSLTGMLFFSGDIVCERLSRVGEGLCSSVSRMLVRLAPFPEFKRMTFLWSFYGLEAIFICSFIIPLAVTAAGWPCANKGSIEVFAGLVTRFS